VNGVVLEAPVGHLEPAAWARCIRELPSLPSAFIAAVKVLSEDDAPASSCIEAIERDQALTVRVLRLANSAFYGAPGQVARVEDAVQMLGLRTVASTLAAVSLRATLGSLRCEGFCFDTYWRHTLCTALTARELAKISSLDAGEAFLLGLLHDVGQLVLAVTSPELEARALLLCRSQGLAMHEAERRVFGVSHPEVGAAVARQWNFPSRISEAIAAHHSPAPITAGQRLTFSDLGHLANRMAHGLDTPSPADIEALLSDPLWSVLGTGEQRLRDLAERVEAELQLMACA
jgi:putative nucleotidyltransferase with HDIG domain